MVGSRKLSGLRLPANGSRQGWQIKYFILFFSKKKGKVGKSMISKHILLLLSYWINKHTGERTDEDPFKFNLPLEMKNKVTVRLGSGFQLNY